MVLVAAVALGSSTYAWFAANNKVTANGMSISAQNNTTALLISATKTEAANIQADGLTTDSAVSPNDTDILFPAAHDTFSTAAAVPVVSNWYSATSDDPNSATMKQGTKKALTDFDEYVLVNTFYITVAKGSAAMKDLMVDSITINGDPAGRVVVATTEGFQEFSSTLASGANTSGATLAASITDSTVIPVQVYFYLDGNEEQAIAAE